MMDKDKKAQLLMILAKRKPGKVLSDDEPQADDESEGDFHKEGTTSAAKDLLDAIKTSNPEQMAEALSNFIDLHCDKEDESQDPTEE